MSPSEAESKQFLADLAAKKIPRVPGTAIFLTKSPQTIPPLMIYHVQHMGSLHERVVTLTVEFEETPRVDPQRRCEARHVADGIWHAVARFGFIEIPDLCRALGNLRHLDPKIDTDNGVYFAARDLIVRKPGRARPATGACRCLLSCIAMPSRWWTAFVCRPAMWWKLRVKSRFERHAKRVAVFNRGPGELAGMCCRQWRGVIPEGERCGHVEDDGCKCQ